MNNTFDDGIDYSKFPPLPDRFYSNGSDMFFPVTSDPEEGFEISQIIKNRMEVGQNPHDFDPAKWPDKNGMIRCFACGKTGVIDDSDPNNIGWKRCPGATGNPEDFLI